MPNPLIESLLHAVEARPTDVPLRLHLAELLIQDGRGPEAVQHCAIALQHDPTSTQAHALMGRAFAQHTPASQQPEQHTASREEAGPTAEVPPSGPAAYASDREDQEPFNWSVAEEQFTDGPGPMFVTDETNDSQPTAHPMAEQLHDGPPQHIPPEDVWEVERAGITLADVGGMQHVKERLEISFLAPMRNPELRQLYGKSLRGGLLLYGPPGCGKTYIARAIAGEMGAGFINVTLSDVLDMYIGQSEGNLHDLFELARRSAPAVLFLDEIDAIGHKRTQSGFNSLRNVVNQLLQELDGVGSDNEGVFVLAATNTPWDVDPALRRPGRLDRSVLVLPPDEPARAAILQHNLARRPVEGINLARLARDTRGFTGADLTHLCESAAELAMIDSVRSGRARMIGMKDLATALKQVRPSARPWFDMARNVVTYADPSGEYADLAAYMKQNKLL
ncbi:AAA family ATPase [Granulicoccus sp. GXG6511]|uniref:AAA family ATPase n=1 Tax=Granulicoccus sp. GXG6511 TaxID=3381351 RepID=UPI003D7C8DF7